MSEKITVKFVGGSEAGNAMGQPVCVLVILFSIGKFFRDVKKRC